VAVFQRYVVSHAQRDLWSLQKLVPESAAYNVVSAWRIRSRVDDGALAEAIVEMANRHDALRTTYRERDGAVWAEVHDRADGLRLVDARGTTDAEMMLQIADEAHRPFDLEHGHAPAEVVGSLRSTRYPTRPASPARQPTVAGANRVCS